MSDSRVGAVVEEKHQEMARSFHGRLRDCCECSDPFEAEAHMACSACVALALAFAEFGAEEQRSGAADAWDAAANLAVSGMPPHALSTLARGNAAALRAPSGETPRAPQEEKA
jgi:hypothetical protein